jgi:SAM-dependent methyltransferase
MNDPNAFDAPGDPERTAYVLDVIKQRRPIEGTSVLDLACRMGAFSRACANAGATVIGIEGKSGNFDRIPETPGATFIQGDVRNLESLVDGNKFDVTLCLGILYHLGGADAVNLLRAMRNVTTDFAIIDTHIGGKQGFTIVDGHYFTGTWFSEPGEPSLWSSIGNLMSFWFAPDQLEDAARMAGWDYVKVLPGVRWPGEPAGRHWLVLA